jgi:hypothetical protein
MPMTTSNLVKQVRERLQQIDAELERLQAERAELKAAVSGEASRPRTIARKPGKRTKGKGGISPQAVSQFGRRYKEAIKAGDTARAKEFETKLNRAGAMGKAKLKEIREALTSHKSKPRAKKKAASPTQAAA